MKQHKFKFYYTEKTGTKPNETITRHFIHSKESCGLWAEVRDLSRKELVANNATGQQNTKIITVGYNPRILELYTDLIVLDEQGKTYRIKNKPDEFNYSKCDIKIEITEFQSNENYGGEDVYDNPKSGNAGN